MELIVQGAFRFTAGKVKGRHRIPVIHRRSAMSYLDRGAGEDGVPS
jgi:hypothetical protein